MKAAHFNEDNENISPSAIKTCFKRSTLALTCKVIVEEIESDDINAPVRTWINCHLEEFFCKIDPQELLIMIDSLHAEQRY